MSRLNLRKRPRVCYYEPEEPPFDEYVYCTECGDYVYEYCSIHGPLLVIPDDKVVGAVPAGVPRAALTVPRVFLHLAASDIPGAGAGVFSSLALPRGVRFGPYRGARRAHAGDSDYGWQIFDKNHKPSHIVDAADDNRSNWMRYVNCARHSSEQNLVAYQYQGQLYYRTVKIIPRFSELLVFYGSEFARALGVDLRGYRTPCGCPHCQANQQKSAPAKVNKQHTKVVEKPKVENILKVSSAEKNQETPLLVKLDSGALPAPSKKTKKSTFKSVTKKSPAEKVQNPLLGSIDNSLLNPEALPAPSGKEKNTTEPIVNSQANLPKQLVGIANIRTKKSTVRKAKKIENALIHSNVIQKATDAITESNYNTNTKESFKTTTSTTKETTETTASLDTNRNTNQTHFKCDKCDKNFDIKSDLEKHLHTHALIESNKTVNKDFVCRSCRNTFNTKLLLIDHRISQHGVQYLPCPECNYKTDLRSNLLIHMRQHTGEKPFKCDHCSYPFSRKHHLVEHQRIHAGEKPFKCDHCSYPFSRKHHLVEHQRIHAGEKPFKCDHCSYAFSQKINLVTHQRIHTGEKPFKCDHCSYAFNQKINLVTHQRIHTGEKPFKCGHCSYAFSRNTSLVIHQRIHTGEKPFKCGHCSYAFSRNTSLVIHQRIHTGEKPFKCDICEYKTAYTNSLKQHLMRVHSGKKPFSCDVCSYKSATKADLTAHLKSHK